jgi:hypothetical protein
MPQSRISTFAVSFIVWLCWSLVLHAVDGQITRPDKGKIISFTFFNVLICSTSLCFAICCWKSPWLDSFIAITFLLFDRWIPWKLYTCLNYSWLKWYCHLSRTSSPLSLSYMSMRQPKLAESWSITYSVLQENYHVIKIK